MSDIVWGSYNIKEFSGISFFTSMTSPDKLISTMLIEDLTSLRSNFLKCFFPRNRLEFVISDPFHRLGYPTGIVHIIGYTMTSGTEFAHAFHISFVAFYFPKPSVFNVGPEPTSTRTTVTKGRHFRYFVILNILSENFKIHGQR